MPESSDQPVLFERRGVLGRIVLNRPPAINALNATMIGLLQRRLDRWADDPGVQVVSIEGAGDRGLCAGGDIVEARQTALGDHPDPSAFWRAEYALDATIAAYAKPVVSFMDGIVMGGGVGISAYAAVRLVTERTRSAMPETIIGFFPDVGALYPLSRAAGELGTHLALTGVTFAGPDAIEVGLADVLMPSGSWPLALDRLAAGLDPKELLREGERPVSPLAAEREWIDECYAGDDPVAIVERLGTHPAPEAREAAALIAQRSPLSVAVTLEAIRRARTMASLQEVLDQDLALVKGFLRGSDFPEGVRALLVDKDKAPRWRHASLAEVTRGEVLGVFEG